MTANTAGQTPSEGGAASSPENEMAAVQSAARWLVAAAAAVATVLLTGVQFSALGRLTTEASAARLSVALIASVVGLLAVGVLLVLAARVLIHPGWTLSHMAGLETFEPQEWAKHWLREQLSARRALLVSSTELQLGALYRRARGLMVAWHQLLEQGEATVPPQDTGEPRRTYKLSDEKDVQDLRARREAAAAEADGVTATANLLATRRRYRHLVRALPVVGLPLIAAVVAFAAAVDAPPPVTAPLAVRVFFTPDAGPLMEAEVPRTCAGRTVDAVAVAGNWEEPVVVAADPSCVLSDVQITDAAGIVVPVPPAK